MILRQILKQLALPPGNLILFLLLAWLLRKRLPRLAGLVFVLALGSLYLLCLPITTNQLARTLENQPVLSQSHWSALAAEADALVILGGGRESADPAWRTDQPSLFAAQRLRYAARIQRTSGLPVLVSGGQPFDQPPSEARIMADSLQHDFGIPVNWLEEQSRTTLENAEYSARILLPTGHSRIVLVTDAWHMQRSRWSFEQAGFTVLPAPQGFYSTRQNLPLGGWLPDSRAFWQNSQLLHEWQGLAVYRLQALISP